MALLEKGPKYNLHTKKKRLDKNLASKTETAISQLTPLTEMYTETWQPSASTPSYKITTPELKKHTIRNQNHQIHTS